MAARTKKIVDVEIEESSGNVFSDLGFTNPEEHRVKANLAIQINSLIDKKGLNQTESAKLLGVDQPKISALSRGILSGFSIERLFKFLAILNQDIEIRIMPHHARDKHTIPHIHVIYGESR